MQYKSSVNLIAILTKITIIFLNKIIKTLIRKNLVQISPMVASQKYSLATSPAMLAPISTAQFTLRVLRMTLDMRSTPLSLISRP